jgi:hypothetical protein
MTTVAEARADLYAGLVTAGLLMTETSGGAVPPQCFLVPGDPYTAPSTLGLKSREVSFTIIGLIGTASDAAISADADALAEAISTAVYTAGALPWSLADVSALTPYDVGGATYLSVQATVRAVILSS